MEIDHNLEAELAGALYCLNQVGVLASYVWLVRTDIDRPVSDGNSDGVETGGSHVFKVIASDEGAACGVSNKSVSGKVVTETSTHLQ